MSRRATALAESAPLFAALGDETRLRLVSRLCGEGPLSITQLTEGGAVTRQAVTRHLEVLADAGLVRDEKQGRERVWALEPRRLSDAKRFLDQMSDRWDKALDRLKRAVEE